ncbi:MAG: transposase [Gemmatimonadota bacterium]|nr:transposase [Gemmatimonadota bacterium]
MRYVGWQCRLYPNRPQARALARCRGELRELSNALIGASYLKYSETGRHLRFKEFRASAQDWSRRRADRSHLPSSAVYQTAADVHAAFRNWFRKVRPGQGLPRFRPEGRAPGIYLSSAAIRFDANRVRLPKFGWMRWRGGDLPGLRLPGPKRRAVRGLVSGRAWRDAGERWMLSCVFECGPLEPVPPAVPVAEMRRDGGGIVAELDGTPLVVGEAGGNARTDADRRRLGRLQRRLSRCRDGSARKARLLERFRTVARRIRNRDRDRRHKLTTAVVRAAGAIVAEEVGDEVLRQLRYKAAWHGRELQVRRGPPEPGRGSASNARGDRRLPPGR